MRLPISPLPHVLSVSVLSMVFAILFCTGVGNIPGQLLSGGPNVAVRGYHVPQINDSVVLCPVIFIATLRATPARSMFRTAQRRRS